MLQLNLIQQLRRQLLFLQNSAAAFDAGCEDEAVRIAVAIRVLCHDTDHRRGSVSLFRQLQRKQSLQLVTSARTLPDDMRADVDFAELLAGMTIGKTIRYSRIPEGLPTIACSDWWVQPVFYRDRVMYSRKEVVLAAANKDGGAHVDDPDSKLQAFRKGFWHKTVAHGGGRRVTVPVENNHFRMLRRFADELLSSQELLELIGGIRGTWRSVTS